MRVLSRLTRVAALAVTAVVALTAAPMAASAATTAPAKVSATANLPHSNYRSPVQYMVAAGTAKGVSPQVTGSGGSISASHSTEICPIGCAPLQQGFSTTYSSNFFTGCWYNINGYASAFWEGINPIYADRMTLANDLWVAGIGVSVSAGASVGAGVSVTNNTIHFTESANHAFLLSHSFTNASFCTLLGMTGPYENSRDSATFGTHTWTDFIS